ncbi:MAG: hypothetical protein R3F11_13005 [Verrucomicrobiales bacterium]
MVLSARGSLPYYLALPLAAAAIYALGSVLVKRGLLGAPGGRGIPRDQLGDRSRRFCRSPAPRSGSGAWHLPVANGTSFLGGWLTPAAIRRGDVSLATPVMGTKVVFVAIAAVAFAGMELPPSLWVAAGLAAAGIATMGLKAKRRSRDVGRAAIWQCIGLSVLSALCYGIGFVTSWYDSRKATATAYIADSSIVVALLSFAAAPFSRSARQGLRLRFPLLPPSAGSCGSCRHRCAGDAHGIRSSATFADAPATNVVYATRGLWAIAIVWALGARLGMPEAIGAPKAVLRWRLAGALLLTGGVILAIIARA